MNSGMLKVALPLVALWAQACHAERPTQEWRLLGPAASYHFSMSGAQRHTEVLTDECRLGAYVPAGHSEAEAAQLGITSKICGEHTTAMRAQEEAGELRVACRFQPWKTAVVVGPTGETFVDAVSVCRYTRTQQVPRWNSNNPAAGFEVAWRYSDRVDKAYATLVRDSYGKDGAMLGAARLFPVGQLGSVSFDAGLTAGLWYRTVLDVPANTLHRALVPFVLPALSIGEEHSGIGLNTALVPRASLNGTYLSTTWALLGQLSYRVRRKENAQSEMSLHFNPDGSLRAALAMRF